MPNERTYQDLLDRVGALEGMVADRLSSQLLQNPQLADQLTKQVDDLMRAVVDAERGQPPPPDMGTAQLAGIGPEAAASLGQTRIPFEVAAYDETVNAERVNAVADLYYLYQHERIGVFRVVRRLQELFRAGTVMLSAGPGAYGLYKFDRRQVLRYTERERLAAYRRVLGYGAGPVPRGSRANTNFHRLFTHFNTQVALYFRDKRISDVIRERAFDPTFGSIAIVRRAGLDLRNNLKFTSFGHLNVLRVEVMQVLDEAFRILESDDIRRLCGADTPWDVIEYVLVHYFNEPLVTSPRQRMAVAGREVLRWLSRPHVNETTRAEFEALLNDIAEYAEEWLTSAQSIGVAAAPSAERRVLPWDHSRRPTAPAPGARPRARNSRRPAPAMT
jgi:hypothetical protein